MALDLSVFERFAKTYQKNDILFCEFEPGDNFYLIQSGRVEITKIIDNIEKTLIFLIPARSSVKWQFSKEPPVPLQQ